MGHHVSSSAHLTAQRPSSSREGRGNNGSSMGNVAAMPAYFAAPHMAGRNGASSMGAMAPPPRPVTFSRPHSHEEMNNMADPSTSLYSSLLSETSYAPNVAPMARMTHNSNEPIPVRLPSDQIRQVVEALSPRSAERAAANGVSMAQVAPPLFGEGKGKQRDGTYGLVEKIPAGATSQRPSRAPSDVSMHADCGQFPTCTVDNPNGGGGVIHKPQSGESRDRDEQAGRGSRTVSRRPASPKGKKRDHSNGSAGGPRKFSKTS